MESLVIANIIGALGFILGKSAMFFRSDEIMKLILGFSLIFSSIQYLYLNEMVGFLMLSIAGLRFITFSFYKHVYVMYFFLVAFLALGYFSIENIIGIIPISMAIFTTIAAFYLSGIHLRLAFIVCTITWSVYNFACGAYVSGLLDLSGVLTSVIALIHIYKPQLNMFRKQTAV